MTTHNVLFFPRISRRDAYVGKGPGKTSSYADYRSEIETDCKQRCIYCDVAIDEHGFEGMVIDHFRPEKHFKSLASDPLNLVLACPKCNRSKWDHWPCDKDVGSPSFKGELGFVDPFIHDRNEFFNVQRDGSLEGTQPPSFYMIELLKLNRKARIQVRRRRIVRNEFAVLFRVCTERTENLHKSWRDGIISPEVAMHNLDKWQKTHEKLHKIFNEMFS